MIVAPDFRRRKKEEERPPFPSVRDEEVILTTTHTYGVVEGDSYVYVTRDASKSGTIITAGVKEALILDRDLRKLIGEAAKRSDRELLGLLRVR